MSGMRTGKIALGIVAIAACIALAALLSTCGGKQPLLRQGHGGQAAGGTFVSLDDTLAELEGMECPEGVDEELWGELKGALGKALICRAGSPCPALSKPHSPIGAAQRPRPTGDKFVSTPPTGEANRVNDLVTIDINDKTFKLSWHYKNLGDYDQNGIVAVEDIIPLAQHFGEDATPENEWIDGDFDGRVHISDITPIAINLTVNVDHYDIEKAEEEAGPWTSMSNMPQHSAFREARFFYELVFTGFPSLWLRVVPVDSEGTPGEASNAVLRPSREPIIYEVSPTEGYQHEEYAFSATVTGDEPLTYAWDFGGGAEPDTSSESSPTVALADAGEYAASLTVTNAYGNATYPFTLTVSERDTWAHTWGGQWGEGAVDMAVDGQGDIYVLGETNSFGAGSDDVLVLKYSPDGDVLWAKTWGTPVGESPAGFALVDGGLLVVGDTYVSDARRDDVFFLKYDLDGNLLWARVWGTPDYETVLAIAVDDQENIQVVGEWLVYGGEASLLAAKFTAEGHRIWAKTWRGDRERFAVCTAVDHDGGMLVAGRAQNLSGDHDVALLKYTTAGTLQWTKSWGGERDEWVTGLAAASGGGMWVVGSTRSTSDGTSDVYMLSWSNNGELLSANTWSAGDSDIGPRIFLDNGGSVYLAAETMSFGPRRALLLKYDASGSLISNKVSSQDWLRISSLGWNQSGDVYLAGTSVDAAVSWTDVVGTSGNIELATGDLSGIESELAGTEGAIEGFEVSPTGIEDIGAGSVDVLLLKNVI